MTDWRGFALSIAGLCVLISMISKGAEKVGRSFARNSEIILQVGGIVIVVVVCFFVCLLALIPFLADLMNGEKTLWVVSLWRFAKRVMREGARGGKGFFKW